MECQTKISLEDLLGNTFFKPGLQLHQVLRFFIFYTLILLTLGEKLTIHLLMSGTTHLEGKGRGLYFGQEKFKNFMFSPIIWQ